MVHVQVNAQVLQALPKTETDMGRHHINFINLHRTGKWMRKPGHESFSPSPKCTLAWRLERAMPKSWAPAQQSMTHIPSRSPSKQRPGTLLSQLICRQLACPSNATHAEVKPRGVILLNLVHWVQESSTGIYRNVQDKMCRKLLS